MRKLEENFINYSGDPPVVDTFNPDQTIHAEWHQPDGVPSEALNMAVLPVQSPPVAENDAAHDQHASEPGPGESHTAEASSPVRLNNLAYMTGIVHYMLYSSPTPERAATHSSLANMSPGHPRSHGTARSEMSSPTHLSLQHTLPIVAATEQTLIQSHIFVGMRQQRQRHLDIRDLFCSPVLLPSRSPKICYLLAALERSPMFPSLTAVQKSNTHVAQSSVPHSIGSDQHRRPSEGYRPFSGVYLTLCPDSPGPSQDVVYPADEEAAETSTLRRRQHLSVEEPIFVLYMTIEVNSVV